MELTVGSNQFFWPAETWSGFYDDLTRSPVDRVVIGELVCSKRLPFYQDRIPQAISKLVEAGKDVALTSLALVTLKRERRLTAELAEMGVTVEINDLTALAYLPEGNDFSVGPLVNVYNEGTLTWLASRGARRVCLPPELPLGSVETLAKAAADLGIAIEVWGHGRLPLAIFRALLSRAPARAQQGQLPVCLRRGPGWVGCAHRGGQTLHGDERGANPFGQLCLHRSSDRTLAVRRCFSPASVAAIERIHAALHALPPAD